MRREEGDDLRNLTVEIEIGGATTYVGNLVGNDSLDAQFSYAESYLAAPGSRPISVSLPLEEKTFDAARTRNFFEGLLPEGFTRRSVAAYLRAEAGDYLTLLEKLGRECLGAITVREAGSPEIPAEYRRLAAGEVKRLAQEGATESADLVTKSHVSLTGASGKVGLYYDADSGQWYLPIGAAPSTHIVKQSHIRLKRIVTNEQLCLLTARKLGIEVPESFIVRTDSPDEEDVLFATKRYDRKPVPGGMTLNGLPVPWRLHQEDFAQALGIPSGGKYERDQAHYLKRAFDLIRGFSENPMADQLKLWDLCVFHYLIGNTDNHIKNFSLLYRADLRTMRLAPAYDIISTVIYESSTEEMSLSIGGTYNICEITRESFAEEARQDGLGVKMALKRFDAMAARFEGALKVSAEELAEQGYPEALPISDQILEKRKIALKT